MSQVVPFMQVTKQMGTHYYMVYNLVCQSTAVKRYIDSKANLFLTYTKLLNSIHWWHLFNIYFFYLFQIQMQTNFRDPEEILISFRSLLPEFDSSAKHKKPNTDPCIISEIEHGNFISKWMQTLPVNCEFITIEINSVLTNN